MEFNWVVEQSLFITDDEMENMTNVAQDYMREGYEQNEAVEEAVRDYMAGQDDCIYYGITEEVVHQIEDEINERLT